MKHTKPGSFSLPGFCVDISFFLQVSDRARRPCRSGGRYRGNSWGLDYLCTRLRVMVYVPSSVISKLLAPLLPEPETETFVLPTLTVMAPEAHS